MLAEKVGIHRVFLAHIERGAKAPSLELALLKRMLRLAWKRDRLLRVPPIEMLKDSAPREGFFEDHQYEAVRRRLPTDLQVAVAIMHTYGWRKREVLTLERRQLDLKAGTLRLEPGTTKNSEGRGGRRATRRACLGAYSMTSGGRRCGTSNGEAWPARSP